MDNWLIVVIAVVVFFLARRLSRVFEVPEIPFPKGGEYMFSSSEEYHRGPY